MTFLRDEAGAAMVELAVLLPVFVLIFVGVADYAFLIEQKIQLQEAATAGAAYATIPGNSTAISGMIAAARASAPQFRAAMTVSAVNVYRCTPGGAQVISTTTCSGLSGPLLFAEVTTTATESTVLQYVGFPTGLTLQGFTSYEVVP